MHTAHTPGGELVLLVIYATAHHAAGAPIGRAALTEELRHHLEQARPQRVEVAG